MTDLRTDIQTIPITRASLALVQRILKHFLNTRSSDWTSSKLNPTDVNPALTCFCEGHLTLVQCQGVTVPKCTLQESYDRHWVITESEETTTSDDKTIGKEYLFPNHAAGPGVSHDIPWEKIWGLSSTYFFTPLYMLTWKWYAGKNECKTHSCVITAAGHSGKECFNSCSIKKIIYFKYTYDILSTLYLLQILVLYDQLNIYELPRPLKVTATNDIGILPYKRIVKKVKYFYAPLHCNLTEPIYIIYVHYKTWW